MQRRLAVLGPTPLIKCAIHHQNFDGWLALGTDASAFTLTTITMPHSLHEGELNMRDKPLISIITSHFNQREYLRQLFACVSCEKDELVEFVVIDGGSTDGSLDVILQWRALIDRLEIGPDRGPADGWRRGLSLASGEFVLFMNGDDVLLPRALERVKSAIRTYPNVDVFVAHGLIVDERVSKSKLFYSHFPRVRTLARGIGVVCQQSTVMRRAILPPINIENRTCWDAELLIDALASGARSRRIEDVWGVFRMTESSISGCARTREQTSRYRADRRKIAEKYGVGGLLAHESFTANVGRLRRSLDYGYHALWRRLKDLEMIKAVGDIWPA